MRIPMLLTLLPIIFWAFSPLAFAQSQQDVPTPYWIEKAARTLRGGEGLGPDEDMDAYLKMSRQDIVDQFQNDPRFGLTVLNFAEFFLQRGTSQQNPATTNPPFGNTRTNVPQALAAARSVVMDGDFWALMAGTVPQLMAPLENPTFSVPENNDPIGSSPEILSRERRVGIRLKHRNAILKRLDDTEVLVRVAITSGSDVESACRKVYALNTFIRSRLKAYGLDVVMAEAVFQKWLPQFYYSDANTDYPQPCEDGEQLGRALTRLNILRQELPKFFTFADALPERLNPKVSVAELFNFSFYSPRLPDLRSADSWTANGFWKRLINSSTNFDRKRASYVLKTYLCDNLIPFALPETQTHEEGNRHASDPGCQSCHYKLDPIAGLFRYRGASGKDYKSADYLEFDDGSAFKGHGLQVYYDSWKFQNDWQVGYFKAPGVKHQAWSGSELDDLWSFMRKAPEVKQCLARRLTEFFLGSNQAYDRDWLTAVSAGLVAGPHSGVAVKETVKKIVLSQAFTTPNSNPTTCYDAAPGVVRAETAAPCLVRYFADNYCASCHVIPGAGLNVTNWVPTSDGSYAFEYWQDGKQLPSKQVFQNIELRLTDPNVDRRMPRGASMSDQDRQLFLRWLQQQQQQQQKDGQP